ncbi:MAG: aspartate carbamoyltransferase, partial [Chloroflexi bacterium]|nr:aspartate carbamoyltransferase [Chloroflexota bacterium]
SSSFIAAMARLGGATIPIHGVQYSSVTKGESLPDTIRTLQCYADVIVLRHPEVGASEVAARYATKPVISAGDGIGEHPTQGLLDLYTIYSELGVVDGLHVAMVGDLKNGRTVHSLARLLRLYDTRFTFVSPEILRLPEELKGELTELGLQVEETDRVEDVIREADIVYVTRVQKERFADLREYEAVKDYYEITPELMGRAKERMALMHPLPRVGEIHYDVDDDPRAAYFRQMENGMYIRMALLAAVLGKA